MRKTILPCDLESVREHLINQLINYSTSQKIYTQFVQCCVLFLIRYWIIFIHILEQASVKEPWSIPNYITWNCYQLGTKILSTSTNSCEYFKEEIDYCAWINGCIAPQTDEQDYSYISKLCWKGAVISRDVDDLHHIHIYMHTKRGYKFTYNYHQSYPLQL